MKKAYLTLNTQESVICFAAFVQIANKTLLILFEDIADLKDINALDSRART